MRVRVITNNNLALAKYFCLNSDQSGNVKKFVNKLKRLLSVQEEILHVRLLVLNFFYFYTIHVSISDDDIPPSHAGRKRNFKIFTLPTFRVYLYSSEKYFFAIQNNCYENNFSRVSRERSVGGEDKINFFAF